MIKKLRNKFILLAMSSLLLVLVLIIGAINVLSFQDVVKNADGILNILADNHGRFPKGRPSFGSPEMPYESRYFSVTTDETGAVQSVDVDRIAAVDEETAAAYAQRVLKSQDTRGFLGNYRYICRETDTGSLVIFLDCQRNLSTFRHFLLTSCGISALGLGAVFCLILLFSRRIIRPVAESFEKQKQFITDAGHELKTPVTIISADADILEMELGDNEWLRDIQKQTERLASLTGSLVYLSRMEEEHRQLQMVDFPVSDIVSETARSFQALARTQNKTFTVSVQSLLTLCGDEKSIRQLVSILLDNSLKYSGDGGDISLSLRKAGRTLRLTVYNTTDQIDRSSLDRLFDRFYRADQSRSAQTGGYGIGLSIARAIVNAHKGKITASSRDGHSLLITVSLPAGKG